MTTIVLLSICFILMYSPVIGLKCIRETISPNVVNQGFIHSPGYPRDYPSNVCYIWYHMVTRETKVVIEIQDLEIPSIDDCRSNSSNRLLIGPHNKRQYCGRLHSDISYEAVISDYFYIVFIINESFVPRGRGFLLHYRLSTPDTSDTATSKPTTPMPTTPPRNIGDISDTGGNKGLNQPCFFSTMDRSGVITIPKSVIPKQLEHGVDRKTCSWLLQTPKYLGSEHGAPTFRYTLRFDRFHFFPDCCSLDIFEGYSAKNGRLVGHYYSASHPHLLYALGPQVFMRLTFKDYGYFGNFTLQFQREEICMPGYKACSYNESGCYLASKACDGVWDCPLRGGDERGCTASCSEHKFSCGNTSAYCYFEHDRCNGKGSCANHRDEENCTPSQCSSDKGLFLCKNRRCIFEKWRCDHARDCEDGSDEENCERFSSPRLIIACVVGTLISSLLLVLALSFAIRVYALRIRRRHGDLPSRHESPLSRIEQDLLRRRAPPPQYNEAMMTSRSYDEAYLELLNQGQTNATESSTLLEGGNNNSSGSTTGSRRERSRRGNRRRSGRDRRLHRNLRIQQQQQQQQQHLQGCPPLPPPPPLHYFTEQPPSYSDSTSGATADVTISSSSPFPTENHPMSVSSDFSTGDGRNHELQPLSTLSLPSPSTNASSEPDPPPYSLHNIPHSDSSGSDDDEDDDIDDDDDDDEMIDVIDDTYMNNNFSSASSSRRVDDDDDCLLLRGGNSEDDDEDDDDDEEEDDTCLSVIPESTHAHLMSFAVPPLPPNTTLSSDLMTATELEQMSSIIKEDDSDDNDNDDGDDKKEEVVENTKNSTDESESAPQITVEDSCDSPNENVAHCSSKESSGTQGEDGNVDNEAVDDDDDDDECILSGEVAHADDDCGGSYETSDTACLLAS